ncbi:hypothetical protein [Variovorax sp. PBL-E5]|uniref:hypothetical protein n=1 Tax=Variovorax sp. PBL-E5 TaxID=434014 RepID=UPI0013A539C0|nr:hypothetical protein [Variovorax sp. PBL-E5]
MISTSVTVIAPPMRVAICAKRDGEPFDAPRDIPYDDGQTLCRASADRAFAQAAGVGSYSRARWIAENGFTNH